MDDDRTQPQVSMGGERESDIVPVPETLDPASITPEKYLSVADQTWFNQLPQAVDFISQQVKSIAHSKPLPVVGLFLYDSLDPGNTTRYMALGTDRVDGGYAVPDQIVGDETTSSGTTIVGLPENMWQVNLMTPISKKRIPLAVTFESGAFLVGDEQTTAVWPKDAKLELKLQAIAKAVEEEPHLQNLFDPTEIEAIKKLGETTNVLPPGFTLSEDPIPEDKMVFGPGAFLQYLTNLIDQPTGDTTTICQTITRGENQMLIVPTLETKRMIRFLGTHAPDGLMSVLEPFVRSHFSPHHMVDADYDKRVDQALSFFSRLFHLRIFTKKQAETKYHLAYPQSSYITEPYETNQENNTREKQVKEKVIRQLENCRIPNNSLVLSHVQSLLSAIGYPVITADGKSLINITEFEQILAALSERQIRFVGSNLFFPQLKGSKIIPAKASHIAGLPYPETYLVKNNQWEQLHPGIPEIEGLTQGAVLKSTASQGGQKVTFLPDFKPGDSSLTSLMTETQPDDFYIYMREVDSRLNEEARSRDSRLIYDSERERLVTASDRIGPAGSRLTNIFTGGEWQPSMVKDNRQTADFLKRFNQGVIEFLTAQAYGDRNVESVMQMYQRLQMTPSYGMSGYDLIFPKRNYPKGKNPGSTPFVCEVHHLCSLQDKSVDDVAEYTADLARSNSSHIVIPQDRLTAIPALVKTFNKGKPLHILVENMVENAAGIPFLDLGKVEEKEQAALSYFNIAQQSFIKP